VPTRKSGAGRPHACTGTSEQQADQHNWCGEPEGDGIYCEVE
jgi:hypothetical protein